MRRQRDGNGSQSHPPGTEARGAVRDTPLANGGVVTVETGWKEADSVTAVQHGALWVFQGQEEHALDLSTKITSFINE